jgi:uncharacterized protein (DUF488 family)
MEFMMIFTIGHSTHSIGNFIDLLEMRGITAIADVRSAPYSRYQPQFNREALAKSLTDAKVEYVFVGDSIGGRSQNPNDFENNRVVYSRLKKSPHFENGVARVISGSEKFKIALMCSEKEPLECHRMLLVGQTLHELGQQVTHIHADGSLESHSEAINRLLKIFNLDEPDLFRTHAEILEEALHKQEQKVAFVLDDPVGGGLGLGLSGASDDGAASG